MNWKFWKSSPSAAIPNQQSPINNPQSRPLPEPKLLAAFHGVEDNALWPAVLSIVDELRTNCYRSAAHQANTERETHMLLGGANTLDTLEATLRDYAARARAHEEGKEEEK